MPDKAEVFISYSRRPPGDRPDPAAEPDAAWRWRARKLALDLTRALEGPINAAGYQVWRDEPAIKVGDSFADKIDAALLSCAGAVILLDPDALDRSSWVRWESGILSWRQHIHIPVRVVPVLIGVAPERFEEQGYGPSRLGDLKAHKIDPDAVDPDSAAYRGELDRHAGEIAAALGELEGEPRGAIAGWINRVAGGLPTACELWQADLAEVIPRGERLLLSARPARVVARELLAAEVGLFGKILNAFYGHTFNDAAGLKMNLEPVWVPAGAVAGVAEANDLPLGERIIAVNATEPRTGADLVRRALPKASSFQRLEITIAAVTPEAAVEEIRQAIIEQWGDDPRLRTEELGGGFVMVSCGGSPTSDLVQIVAQLAAAYPSLTYLVMVGDTEPDRYERLDPGLPRDADANRRKFYSTLQKMIFFND
jgi:hypothetical protein